MKLPFHPTFSFHSTLSSIPSCLQPGGIPTRLLLVQRRESAITYHVLLVARHEVFWLSKLQVRQAGGPRSKQHELCGRQDPAVLLIPPKHELGVDMVHPAVRR